MGMRYLVLALLVSGCEVGLTGNGNAAYVILASDVASTACDYDPSGRPNATLRDAFCIGVQKWNALGANIHCASGSYSGVAMRVTFDDESNSDNDTRSAWYDEVNHQIRVLRPLRWDGEQMWELIAAHETGHALGLEHLPPATGIMSPEISGTELSESDISEFREKWN